MLERLVRINYSCSQRVELETFAYFLDINGGVWLIAKPNTNFLICFRYTGTCKMCIHLIELFINLAK